MKTIRLLALFAMAVSIYGQACAANGGRMSSQAGAPVQLYAAASIDTISAAAKPPLAVVSYSPTGTGVSLNTASIQVTFNAAMNRVPSRTAFSITPRPKGALSWTSSYTLVFQPTAGLAPDTDYTVTISTAAVSGAGVHLAVPFFWSFSTAIPAQSGSVACCGDSITAGLWPGDLQALFSTSRQVDDFGADGRAVIVRGGYGYTMTSACTQALQSQPDIVVFMLGSNDTDPSIYQFIGNFVADYEALIRRFQALSSNPTIWLAKPPHIYTNPYHLSNSNLVQGVLPRIDQVASDMGVGTIDCYTPTTGHPGYFSDGVHPNDQGAAVIANLIYQAIK